MNYYKKTMTVLWVILFANLLVSAVKLIIGNISDCASLSADGIHSFADGASNVVGIIGISIASRPRDKKHPYGHQKFEVLASLFIGMMLFYLSIKIASTGIRAIFSPINPSFSYLELIAVLATIFINIAVSIIEFTLGKRWKSQILVADSIHTRSDIFISIGVLIGIIAVKFGAPVQIDGFISVIIAFIIAFSCYEILKPAISGLVDSNVADCNKIKYEVLKFDTVKEVNNIRSRGSENLVYIDMHITVDDKCSIGCAHKLTHDIEKSLRTVYGENAEVNIHVEPDNRQ